jgi:hypothetical protein
VLKNLRLAIFNWFAAGKLTLTYNKSEEYKPMSSYSIGGPGGSGGITINPNGVMSHGAYSSSPLQTTQTLVIKITPANGGTIVQVNTTDYSHGDLHIVPDGADFDRELGKIITMSKLKS